MLTTKQAAEFLQLSPRRMQELANKKVFANATRGKDGRHLIPKEDLQLYKDSRDTGIVVVQLVEIKPKTGVNLQDQYDNNYFVDPK